MLISCSQNNHNFSTKWENDENYHWHVCQVEGHKDTSKREKHIWNDGEVMKEPSKTETGIMKYVCTTCLKEKTEIIDKLKSKRILKIRVLLDFFYLLNNLYMSENIDVMDTDEDNDKLGIIILFDDKSLILNYDFNEIVNINGTNIMICEYLYGLTNEWVRNYFNVDENIKKRTKIIA